MNRLEFWKDEYSPRVCSLNKKKERRKMKGKYLIFFGDNKNGERRHLENHGDAPWNTGGK